MSLVWLCWLRIASWPRASGTSSTYNVRGVSWILSVTSAFRWRPGSIAREASWLAVGRGIDGHDAAQ